MKNNNSLYSTLFVSRRQFVLNFACILSSQYKENIPCPLAAGKSLYSFQPIKGKYPLSSSSRNVPVFCPANKGKIPKSSSNRNIPVFCPLSGGTSLYSVLYQLKNPFILSSSSKDVAHQSKTEFMLGPVSGVKLTSYTDIPCPPSMGLQRLLQWWVARI